jgi:hypothetical protein
MIDESRLDKCGSIPDSDGARALRACPNLILERYDVCCLQPFGAPRNVKFHGLSFIQRFVAIALNCGEVYENVLSRLPLNKSKTFTGIEPLYCSLFFH